MAVATPDISQRIRPADIIGAGRSAAERAPLNPANTLWVDKINEMKQKADAAGVFKQIAEEDVKPQYDNKGSQQDVARFGGGAGRVDATGKADIDPNANQAQKDRFNEGKKAVENVSAVMFYADIARLPPANQGGEFANLLANNPSFRALGCNDLAALKLKAVGVMQADANINKLLDALPIPGNTYTPAEKQAIITELLLTDPDFAANLSQNFQKAHDRLIQLGSVTPEGLAKLNADKAKADKTLGDKVAALKIQLGRTTNPLIAAMTDVQIKDAILASNSEADFKKQLAIKMGVDAAHIPYVLSIMEERKTLVDLDARLRVVTDNGLIISLRALKSDAETRIQTAENTAGKVNTDAGIVKFQEAVAIVDQTAVKSNVNDAVSASIDSASLTALIAAPPIGVDISTNLNARLDQERLVIKSIEAMLGKSLGETYATRKEQMEVLRDQAVKEAVTAAGSQAEKDLIITMETGYVAYDIVTREKVIKGDNIMNAAKLMSMGDRGLRVLMIRDMELADPDIYAMIFTGDPADQQRAINLYLDDVKNYPEKQAVLDKAMEQHGSEYRLKVLNGYYTMKDHLDEGFFGHAWRPGQKVLYEGTGKGLEAYFKGDAKMNATELYNMHQYCKADVDAAIRNNKEANRFVEKMKASGQVANMEWLKFLTWFFVLLGGGVGTALGGPLGGVAGAGLGGAGKLATDHGIVT